MLIISWKKVMTETCWSTREIAQLICIIVDDMLRCGERGRSWPITSLLRQHSYVDCTNGNWHKERQKRLVRSGCQPALQDDDDAR